jgi:hypothetical protein
MNLELSRMKRTTASKSSKSPKTPPPAPKKALKQVDLSVVREQITKLVGNRAVGMVKTTMDEVDKGHYLAMKYLFEMIGLCPAPLESDAPQDDSLARTLLRRLQFPEQGCSAEVTKDCLAETAEPGDAIK